MTKELRKIKSDIARESFLSHTVHNPLIEGVLGRGEAVLKGEKVTVTFGGKAFEGLTDVSMQVARLYIEGMAMGIACKYDKEFAQLKERNAQWNA